MAQAGAEFNAIRISLASPEQIRAWSYGEVTKPETINYRTLRPEKDGLFDERIFGPTKDWECYCGKYKKIRYKGVICDRCGVEVARAKVRRERMGHIKLAAPVAHIWFSKGTPSRLGLLLDLSPRNLERVLYFAQYVVTNVDDEKRKQAVENLQAYRETEMRRLEEEDAAGEAPQPAAGAETDEDAPRTLEERKERLDKDVEAKITEVESIKVKDLLTEARYRELRDRFGEVFRAGMGAESVLEVLKKTSLDDLRVELQDEVKNTSGQRRKKAIKRLRVVESFRKSGNKPDWMVLTVLPVLPPELHPMVQLDGGRFATSDLNDLYRRVINRNNRLKHLIELQAPDIIVRNEKRMLQEAVDALIDNGRRGRAIQGSHNHKLKSLSDLLRGKQGRFRQNLLGKRVDYSGRSVIVVGPQLKLHECGLPKRMALELFKPFVMNALVIKGYAHNIKSAKRMAERARPEIWDILEEVIQDHPVLLNRAPTLHRLGIQAFQPVLVEGSAIQIHPLVCTAFNADFDGDQMAVHVPLSREAVLEAQRVMLSTYNMLAPSSGEPIVSPTLDMVLGMYYLTDIEPAPEGEKPRQYSDFEDAVLAHHLGHLGLRQEVRVRDAAGQWVNTTAGRIIFNSVLPPEIGFRNYRFAKNEIGELVIECYEKLGNVPTADVLDKIKDMGFRYATQSGTTIAINDIVTPPQKQSLLSAADTKIGRLDEQYQEGLITAQERYQAAVDIWNDVSGKMETAVKDMMPSYGGIYTMQDSGAKGNLAQIKQMAGMRGLMSDPKGRIIEMPIRSSFAEGLSVLEYFISTHGARKGLADTALRTADSGYLTRRLADVAQDVIILYEDCGTRNGIPVPATTDSLQAQLSSRLVTRFTSQPVADPKTGEVIMDANTLFSHSLAKKVQAAGVQEIWVRSPLTCEAPRGLCQKCYGASLARGELAVIGEAVGIIAAQSIGEPGTQLTMRTFHTGGIAGQDITSGLPRVVELFEARSPRGVAVLSEIGGKVELQETPEGRLIKVVALDTFSEEIDIPSTHRQLVKTGDWVDAGQPILGVKKQARAKSDKEGSEIAHPDEILAPVAGNVEVTKETIRIKWEEKDEREYLIPAAAEILVKDRAEVTTGQALTGGPKNPQDILRIEGQSAVQRYMVDEVQTVYRSQGVEIHDKHIETIIRQMLRKVRVDAPGDTEMLPGELVDRQEYERVNNRALAAGGEPATASPLLLGVTRASLNTDSFLAAASFQETARVLTEAAVTGSVDRLMGLKENVIIGRLIPARLDKTEAGRKALGIDTLSRIDGQLTGVTQAPATFEEALAAIGGRDVSDAAEAARSIGVADVRAAASALRSSGGDATDEDDAALAAKRLLGSPAEDDDDEEDLDVADDDDAGDDDDEDDTSDDAAIADEDEAEAADKDE
jgi:DNA-directed RNA polymerase subunit beta'